MELWFGIITQRAIRRGTFRSVHDLVAKIDDFVQHYNRRCHPFVWTATADSLVAKLERLCKAIAGQDTSARPGSAVQKCRHRRGSWARRS